MRASGLSYSGRLIFGDKGTFYFLISRHNGLHNARVALSKSDLFYHGKTTAKITKQGRYYLIVEKLNTEFQDKVRTRLGKR